MISVDNGMVRESHEIIIYKSSICPSKIFVIPDYS